MRDVVGILLSLVCLVHCLGLAFLVPMLSKIGLGFEEEHIHLGLLVFVSIYTAIFLWPQTSTYIRWISGGGLLVLFSAMLFHAQTTESILTVSGSLTLMASHILDLREEAKEIAYATNVQHD